MESAINWIKALLDSGLTPTEIRVDDPWQVAITASDIFTGDAPLLPDPSIIADANPDEEHLIVFVAGIEYRAVLSL